MIYQICGNYAYFLFFVIILKGLQSPKRGKVKPQIFENHSVCIISGENLF